MDGNISSTDKIVDVNIENEMRKSYIEYAMSVIIARALPDVRDGLKPVHRRILYAMNELNLDPTKAYKKSARIVGDTMGKYHPHGDSSIYDAMVRMAQDFSMRYMLVDGHGNFGSVDGDSPAAPRYTEARLSRMSTEMLADIEKETVDFIPNYDEEFQEPSVLPSRFPNLLVNGSSGIAVGMATYIPPHNLNEVIDGVIKIIDNYSFEDRETDINELLAVIKGPDFPTGATIMGTNGIRMAYRTGRGKIVVRSDSIIEPMNGGRERIVVTQLPFQVNKAKLIEKIADLVKEKKVEGISDLRDESDRNGIRVVIELKREASATIILNQLYKYTQLQESFGIIMLALVDNEPKILNLKDLLIHYLNHQKDVVTRRTKFELKKCLKRAHILEGFLIALDHIDEVLSIIRSSPDTATAKHRLVERFKFTDEQVNAILEMRFRNLTGLERDKIMEEYKEIKEHIQELTAILENEKRLYAVIKEEILIIKTKYGDERRTQIAFCEEEIMPEDLIDDEISVITMTCFDYIKRLPLSTYKSQNRGGRGIIGLQMRDEDLVKNILIANTHDTLIFFTSMGRAYRAKAYEIPEAGRTARGMAIINLLNLNKDEKITAVITIRETKEDEYILMVTKQGTVKKTPLSKFSNIPKAGLIAVNLREDDELISVIKTDGDKEVFVVTRDGKGICFNEADIRSMGRQATGVRAIRLAQDDYVVGADSMDSGRVLIVSEKGFGKLSELSQFRAQKRGGSGVKIHKITERTGKIVGVSLVEEKDELMLINSEGIIIRIRVSDISIQSRTSQGVKLINLNDGVSVVSLAKIKECDIEQEAEQMQEEQEHTKGSEIKAGLESDLVEEDEGQEEITDEIDADGRE